MEMNGHVGIENMDSMGKFPFPKDIFGLTTLIVNVFMVGQPNEWVLVDTGISGSVDKIIQESESRFGPGNLPSAIVLTHGHFDHAGSVKELAESWDIPVYVHHDELPYLTGEKDYPPGDPTVGGGFMATISPLYPNDPVNLGNRVQALPENGDIPHMVGWRAIHTPGHTPGHISLFRESDGALIVGDAFITVKQESAIAVITQKEEIHGPPAYFTTDWKQAWESVRKLDALGPKSAYPGHGQVIFGETLETQLHQLAEHFDTIAIPEHGRYVQ